MLQALADFAREDDRRYYIRGDLGIGWYGPV